jgi:serine/threonine protein kinase
VRSSPLPLTDRLLCILQISTVLKLLHSNGVLHGSLKPSNVLVSGPSAFALTDYNLFAIARRDLDARTVFDAPELFTSAYTEASDIYSLGMLIFFIVASHVPRPHRIQQLLEGMRPQVPQAAPRSIRRLIARCWAHDPSARPAIEDVVLTMAGIRVEDHAFDGARYYAAVDPDVRERSIVLEIVRQGKLLVERIDMLTEKMQQGERADGDEIRRIERELEEQERLLQLIQTGVEACERDVKRWEAARVSLGLLTKRVDAQESDVRAAAVFSL